MTSKIAQINTGVSRQRKGMSTLLRDFLQCSQQQLRILKRNFTSKCDHPLHT